MRRIVVVLLVGVVAGCSAGGRRPGSAATATPATPTAPAAVAAGTATAVSDITKALQKDLRLLGATSADPSGTFDPATTRALATFETGVHVAADGRLGPDSAAAMDGALGRTASAPTSFLQRALADLCDYTGPADGTFSPALADALRRVEQAARLPVTGRFGAADAAALDARYRAEGARCASPPPLTTSTVKT